VSQILAHGETKSSVRFRDIQVDVRVVEADAWGAALQYFTGSKQHNIRVRELAQRRGLKVSEYGVFEEQGDRRVSGCVEEEVYQAVGFPGSRLSCARTPGRSRPRSRAACPSR
jgi:DNA polymerase (family 10)